MIAEILRELIREELLEFKESLFEVIKQDDNESRYLTRKQVAQYMNIGLSTVDDWSRKRKLRKIEIDGSIRFDKKEIDEFLKKRGA